MAEIVLKHVQKVYPNNESKRRASLAKRRRPRRRSTTSRLPRTACSAVEDFNLTVHDREFVVLVGPSGCGKSTTMRMVAGHGGHHFGRRAHRRQARQRRGAQGPRHCHGVPELCSVPQYDGVREHGVYARAQEGSPRTRSTARFVLLPRFWALPSTSTVSPRRSPAASASVSLSAAPSCVTPRSS